MGDVPGKKHLCKCVCAGLMDTVSVISMGGQPHPCDVHTAFEQQDYIIRNSCKA